MGMRRTDQEDNEIVEMPTKAQNRIKKAPNDRRSRTQNECARTLLQYGFLCKTRRTSVENGHIGTIYT